MQGRPLLLILTGDKLTKSMSDRIQSTIFPRVQFFDQIKHFFSFPSALVSRRGVLFQDRLGGRRKPEVRHYTLLVRAVDIIIPP